MSAASDDYRTDVQRISSTRAYNPASADQREILGAAPTSCAPCTNTGSALQPQTTVWVLRGTRHCLCVELLLRAIFAEAISAPQLDRFQRRKVRARLFPQRVLLANRRRR